MSNSQTETQHVVILMFEGCDLLDTGGPYEVFLTASRLAEREGSGRPFKVEMVTIDGEPVKAYGGLGLVPTATSDVLKTADLVIVPGAIDLDAALADEALVSAIKSSSQRDDAIVATVCTGAFFLGAVGALEGQKWTTHFEDIDLLAQTVPNGAERGVRWVDNGRIVTGGALSSGIAMSLHLVARMANHDLAERTARQLDYVWNNTSLV